MTSLSKVGVLYVIATPIGNLGDITLRALDILRSSDQIVAEHYKHAKGLLHHYSIKKSIISLNQVNEFHQPRKILNLLRMGQSIALISDAGTPLMSDPGFNLVRAARVEGINVLTVPGACAAVAALSISGLPTYPFTFIGFLPSKPIARRSQLIKLVEVEHTLIFYEAPHRLMSFLQVLGELFGLDRKIVVARELTKYHESVVSGSIQEVYFYYQQHIEQQCGEIVVLVSRHIVTISQQQVMQKNDSFKVLNILLSELPVKQAVSLTSAITGERKNALYKVAIQSTT